MSRSKDHRSAMGWLPFSGVIAVLMLLATLIVWNQYQTLSARLQQQADDQMSLLKTAVLNALQDGHYDDIQSLFNAWGKKQQQTVKLQLISKTGFPYATYERANPTSNSIRTEHQLLYGYHGSASLIHTLDRAWINTELMRTIAIVLVALAVVASFGAHLVISSQRQHQKALELAQMSGTLDRQNQRLAAEHALLQAVIDNIPDLIYFKSQNNAFEGANRAFCDFHGFDRESLLGKFDHDLFETTEAEKRHARDGLVIDTRKIQQERCVCRDIRRTTFVLDAHYAPYFDSDHKLLGMVGVERDITQLDNYQESLRAMAYHDPLTGLPNRRYLIDQMQKDLSESTRHGHRVAICAIDLDGFKPINDTHGHEVGDRVIIAFGARLQTLLRSEDTIARWGGDEFTVLLSHLPDNASLATRLQEMVDLIHTPFLLDDLQIQLSASIGVAVFPDDNQDPDTLLRHADQAMYQSKQSGKNTFTFFDPDQDRDVLEQAARLSRLIKAIESDELVLEYQPQIDMLDGSLHGIEALVRWQHPELGRLQPDQFLPLTEGHPSSVKLDWWVIETALKQIRSWASLAIKPKISVNLSPMTLQMSDFVDRLGSLLEQYPEGYGILQMEILETDTIVDTELISRTIQQCKTLGVDFALDDFGTGYSSLTYLRQLPAGTIKIDRSFVQGMLADSDDFKIVEGIVALARAFQRTLVAEGVESIDHGHALLQLGCRYAQGFGIARPMPAQDFVSWQSEYSVPQEWRARRQQTE